MGTNLRSLLESNGIRPAHLAAKTDIPPWSIAEIISGEIPNPTVYTAYRLASFFNMSIDELLGVASTQEAPKPVENAENEPTNKTYKMVPIIAWDDIKEFKFWSHDKLLHCHTHWISTDMPADGRAFAVRSPEAFFPLIREHSLLIVSPAAAYEDQDIVVVSINRSSPTVRRVVSDNGQSALAYMSMRKSATVEPIGPHTAIFGKVLEVRFQVE